MKITPRGEILYDRAKQMITIYEQTRQEILEQQNTIKGDLKIAASFTIGEYILPPLLLDLQNQYPELNLQVTIANTEEVVQSTRSHHVDIGLIEGQTNERELIVTPFLEDELFIVASNQHPLVQKEEATIADLQDQAWIMRENGSGTREYFNHVVRSNALKVKSLLTISSNQGIKETLINGLGISILSGSVVERDVKQNNLSIIKVKNQEFKRTLSYVLSPIMQEKKNVSIFIEALEEKWKHPKEK